MSFVRHQVRQTRKLSHRMRIGQAKIGEFWTTKRDSVFGVQNSPEQADRHLPHDLIRISKSVTCPTKVLNDFLLQCVGDSI